MIDTTLRLPRCLSISSYLQSYLVMKKGPNVAVVDGNRKVFDLVTNSD